MTTSDTMMEAMTRCLQGRTVAGQNIYSPRDWPSTRDLYPMIKVGSFDEDKESLGNNAPQFNTTTKIRLTCTLSAMPKPNDQGAVDAQIALGIWQREIERAVINNPILWKAGLQEFVSVVSRSKVTQDGETHIGELTMDFGLKFYQGPEDFYPIESDWVYEIAVYGDLINVADKQGTYTPPFTYPVAPAPRTSGPDGRVEIGGLVQLPNE